MAQVPAVIATLKQALKEARLTYADVARGLGMSEANVKRMFASERFSALRHHASASPGYWKNRSANWLPMSSCFWLPFPCATNSVMKRSYVTT